KGKGSDTARVAKWGVVVEVEGNGFHTSYNKDEIKSNVGTYTVISADGNVVAPGTKGTFGGVKISGQPEVAVKITTTADVKLSGWNVGTDGEFYCPLKFTIGDTTINGLDYSKGTAGGVNSFQADIKQAIEDATTQEVEAGKDLDAIGDSITYSWEWPFENGTGSAASQSDVLDTLLGDNAVNGEAPTISIDVTTTVTQID
ncbi:MAG: hypothetical protein SOY17_11520, partial [Evtepia sp.]|nr:hypothetical protein [Evtepia sp.]